MSKITPPEPDLPKLFSSNLIRFVFLSLIIFFIYYGFIAFPLSLSAKYLARTKSSLVKYQSSLISLRIPIMQLYSLNPNSVVFIEEKGVAINQIDNIFKNKPELIIPKPPILSNSQIKLIYKDYQRDLGSSSQTVNTILDALNNNLTVFKSVDEKLNNIYAYDPAIDLKSLDYVKDKEKALERIANAKIGLQKIIDDLKTIKETSEIITLSKDIITAQNIMQRIDNNIRSGNISIALNQTDLLIDSFNSLRVSAYKTTLAPLNTNEFLDNLARFTDQIKSLDNTKSSVSKSQERLNEKKGLFK